MCSESSDDCDALRPVLPSSGRGAQHTGDSAPSQAGLSLPVRSLLEGLGTGYLSLAVVGSGIFGQRLTGEWPAFVLLVSAMTTTAVLYALIRWLAPLSGAHLNPLVTIALVLIGRIPTREALAYIGAQSCGALVGVACAHAVFDLPVLAISQTIRHGPAIWLSEFIASFGFVAIALGLARRDVRDAAAAVSCYVGAAFWLTQTDFVNPALTLARAFTDGFAGIRLADVPAFWTAQTAGTAAALLVDRLIATD